ncbi:MAG TPA: response regulator transcription factor [Candidatus Acidoferrum sp.]|nr:response regulator transcription factor [Candidatus Acidoferrum sp.]
MKAPSPQKPVSVLIIDDEPQIQRLLTIALEAQGYAVNSAGTGQAGMAMAAQQSRDLIILDLGLPDTNGLLVLRQLREWTQSPIVVLTVLDGTAEKIEALDSGADDYVTKPFHTEELLARMRAALRRSDKGPAAEPVFHFGKLEVDLAHRRVTREGEPVKLTAKEYALLRLFVQHRGKVLTHRQILREIWGPNHEHDMRSLRVYILRLREKLETDPLASPLFQTEVGVGYRLAES